jgi:uncharacterized protein YndB with AHSA1/START domain
VEFENSVGFGVLDFPCGAERLPDGTTIIVDAGDDQQLGSELLIVDENGRLIWNYTERLRFAHSAVLLPNGNFLVTDTTHNRVIEVTREGEVVFTSDDWSNGSGGLSDGSHLDYPNDAHALDDERLLITDRNNDRCVIVNRSGEVLWEYSENIRHPHNADPLENGNVLIADSDNDRVIEVNPDKEIVWSYGDQHGDSPLAWPRDADRLPNENTLICDSKNNRVIEITPEREIAWEYGVPYFANFYDADRLDNGNTLIVDQQHQRVFEVDHSGTVVWQFRNHRPTVTTTRRLSNGSFKEKDEDGMPAGWRLMSRVAEGGGSVSWQEDETGKDHPVLEFDRSGAVALYQLVTIRSGKRYRIAAELSTNDMSEGSFACLQLAYRDEYGGWFEDVFESPKGTLLEGTTEWTEDVLEVVAPEGARTVEVRVLLVGPGRAHIRRIMMIQV